MKKVVVCVADGSEEIEFNVTIDILRRAKFSVTSLAIGTTKKEPLKLSRDVQILADEYDINKFQKELPDAIVMPGGMDGAIAFQNSKELGKLLQEMMKAKKWICAICAAPLALLTHVEEARSLEFSGYPSLEDKFKKVGGLKFKRNRVTISENIITSQGPGTTFDFALAIVGKLDGETNVKQLKNALLYE
ncbi:hypothetical protein SNEBB_007788 [Seison nebaliae]|nr:hypothetical protein SNEBB_007788 [Seison nebaliae]